jgi:hypothetical protein
MECIFIHSFSRRTPAYKINYSNINNNNNTKLNKCTSIRGIARGWGEWYGRLQLQSPRGRKINNLNEKHRFSALNNFLKYRER